MEKLLCVGFLMLLVLAAALAFLSWRNGSFLQQHSSTAIFRRRRSFRAFMLCMALLMAAGVPYTNSLHLQEEQAFNSDRLSYADLDVAQTTAEVTTVISIGIGLGLMCFCFPEELRLNLDKRTYHLTKGWPPVALIQSGTWDDISGIYIKDIRSAHLVCLSYKHPVGQWTLIGISGKNSGAVRLAKDLALRLSLPLINSPYGK